MKLAILLVLIVLPVPLLAQPQSLEPPPVVAVRIPQPQVAPVVRITPVQPRMGELAAWVTGVPPAALVKNDGVPRILPGEVDISRLCRERPTPGWKPPATLRELHVRMGPSCVWIHVPQWTRLKVAFRDGWKTGPVTDPKGEDIIALSGKEEQGGLYYDLVWMRSCGNKVCRPVWWQPLKGGIKVVERITEIIKEQVEATKPAVTVVEKHYYHERERVETEEKEIRVSRVSGGSYVASARQIPNGVRHKQSRVTGRVVAAVQVNGRRRVIQPVRPGYPYKPNTVVDGVEYGTPSTPSEQFLEELPADDTGNIDAVGEADTGNAPGARPGSQNE